MLAIVDTALKYRLPQAARDVHGIKRRCPTSSCHPEDKRRPIKPSSTPDEFLLISLPGEMRILAPNALQEPFGCRLGLRSQQILAIKTLADEEDGARKTRT